MRSFSSNTTLENTALAAIEAARELEALFADVALDLGHDASRIRAMFEAFGAGHLYRANEEPALETLRCWILGVLSDRVPGYRRIALHCDTTDYFFLDEELEGLRLLWEQLRMFRRLRQSVIDTFEAERQLSTLRRCPAAYAAE